MTFHLAIPSHDLQVSKEFYTKLGCSIGRQYPTHIIVRFFGNQLVCHLEPDACDKEPKMYPRHFGIVFSRKSNLFTTYDHAQSLGVVWKEMFARGPSKPAHHWTFFIKDPSNNVIEFKYYRYREAVY